MKLIEFPNTDDKKEKQARDCAEHISDLLSTYKLSAFVIFAVNEDGQLVSSGQGMTAADLAMASLLVADMSRGALSVRKN